MQNIVASEKNSLINQTKFLVERIKYAFIRKNICHKFTLVFLLILINLTNYAQISMIRLQASGPNNFLDETILYYQTGATLGFDNDYDAYKLSGPNPSLQIAQVYDSTKFQINGVEPPQSFLSMPILIKTPLMGTYTIFATDFGNFPYGTSLILIDKYTGIKTNMKTSNYSFFLSDTTLFPRFDLNISYMNLPIIEQQIPANCLNNTDNYIVKGTGLGPWNYIWKDTNENILKVKLLSNEQDTFNLNLAGTYRVYVESADGFGFNFSEFSIQSIDLPIASFSSTDTTFLSNTDSFIPINNSVNATFYQWNFGDGSENIYDTSNTHVYTTPGLYDVSLIAINSIGCSDTMIRIVSVIDSTSLENNVSIHYQNSNDNPKIKLKRIGLSTFHLSTIDSEECLVSIYDINGKLLFREKNQQESITIELNEFLSGNYFINVATNHYSKTFNITLL